MNETLLDRIMCVSVDYRYPFTYPLRYQHVLALVVQFIQ